MVWAKSVHILCAEDTPIPDLFECERDLHSTESRIRNAAVAFSSHAGGQQARAKRILFGIHQPQVFNYRRGALAALHLHGADHVEEDATIRAFLNARQRLA